MTLGFNFQLLDLNFYSLICTKKFPAIDQIVVGVEYIQKEKEKKNRKFKVNCWFAMVTRGECNMCPRQGDSESDAANCGLHHHVGNFANCFWTCCFWYVGSTKFGSRQWEGRYSAWVLPGLILLPLCIHGWRMISAKMSNIRFNPFPLEMALSNKVGY